MHLTSLFQVTLVFAPSSSWNHQPLINLSMPKFSSPGMAARSCAQSLCSASGAKERDEATICIAHPSMGPK